MATDQSAAKKPRIRAAKRDLKWPGGSHVAIIFNVAYEAWSDGKAPGIGPMGKPAAGRRLRYECLVMGQFRCETGIDRLLRILDRTKLRASVMVSGVLAERQPKQVKAIVRGRT